MPTHPFRTREASAFVAALCVVAATCAAAAPSSVYNPDHLPDAELAQIVDICQNVLGLKPSERPSVGIWPGEVHLPPIVSHYQGCIVSLSNSLQEALEQTRPTSSQLPASGSAADAAAASAAAPARPAAVRSFFYASGKEVAHREQQACMRLGFTPPLAPFASCVRHLQATFFAIDNPID
jgi:hypothetical protein